MKDRTIQGLMIAEDSREGTYFFQTRCGLQLTFVINLLDGWLSIESQNQPDSKIHEMDLF